MALKNLRLKTLTGTTPTWDVAKYKYAEIDPTANVAITLSNAIVPDGFVLTFKQHSSPVTLSINGNSIQVNPATDSLTMVQCSNTNLGFSFSSSYVTGAALTTLNVPTSFAAGTPTSAGAPFTWTDTNSSPDEDGNEIQITLDTDTTYSAVVQTLTPAANATSEAAGTVLSPSTDYIARMRAKGDGTTTADSAWTSNVSFTTAASVGNPELFVNESFDSAPVNTATAAANGGWEVWFGTPSSIIPANGTLACGGTLCGINQSVNMTNGTEYRLSATGDNAAGWSIAPGFSSAWFSDGGSGVSGAIQNGTASGINLESRTFIFGGTTGMYQFHFTMNCAGDIYSISLKVN